MVNVTIYTVYHTWILWVMNFLILFFKEPTVVLQVEELTKIMSQIICPYHDNVWVSGEQ